MFLILNTSYTISDWLLIFNGFIKISFWYWYVSIWPRFGTITRACTWLHLPGTCLLCRWSSPCILQLCSWCDPTTVCTRPGSVAAGGQWSTWLCLSGTGWRRHRTRSCPPLCRHTPHTWFPETGFWCGTCKQRGTRHRWSARINNWKVVIYDTIRQKNVITPVYLPQSEWMGSWLLPAAGRRWCPPWKDTWWTHRRRRNPVWRGRVEVWG